MDIVLQKKKKTVPQNQMLFIGNLKDTKASMYMKHYITGRKGVFLIQFHVQPLEQSYRHSWLLTPTKACTTVSGAMSKPTPWH